MIESMLWWEKDEDIETRGKIESSWIWFCSFRKPNFTLCIDPSELDNDDLNCAKEQILCIRRFSYRPYDLNVPKAMTPSFKRGRPSKHLEKNVV